jgi:predicted ATPase
MTHLRQVTLLPGKYPTRECYPFNLEVFLQTGSIAFDSPVSFFAGENGTGKSTLLKALCRKCGIPIWEGQQRRRLENNRYEDNFQDYIGIEWENGRVPGSFYASEIFRNFSQMLDEFAAADAGQLKYFGGKSLMTQSHGQALLSFFRARYRIRGLYFLDEPETALSPKSQLDLLGVILNAARAGHAQFIIATHSPILLACPGGSIYSFDHIPIRKVAYEETDHYRIYRDFMSDRNRYLEDVDG